MDYFRDGWILGCEKGYILPSKFVGNEVLNLFQAENRPILANIERAYVAAAAFPQAALHLHLQGGPDLKWSKTEFF